MAPIIHAVHDDDLENFFKSIGVLEKFKSGNLKCSFCGDVITQVNLYSIYPDSGAVKFSCNKATCVISLKTNFEGKRYG